MAISPPARRRARYLVPAGAAALTAAIVVIPQAASGAVHPNLPPKTAAQLLASLEQATPPEFSGTAVETAQLGLPSIGDSSLASSLTPSGHSSLMQVVTLLTGSHTAQIAYGGPDKQRVAIFLSDLSEMDVVHNGSDVWTYSSDNNAVTHSTLPADHESAHLPAATSVVDPAKAAEKALAEIDPSTKVTVDRTAEVAGRPAYQLDLNPRDPNTLISSVRIALDSKTSLPLRVEIWSRKNASTPAFSVGFTSLSMSAPSASTFDFTTPPKATAGSLPFSHMFGGGQAEAVTPRAPMHHIGRKTAGTKVLGSNWSSVLVEPLSEQSVLGGSAARPAPGTVVKPGGVARQPNGPSLSDELDQLGTRVAEGHLITTSLLTILITNDNRLLIGAVTPSYIEQLAASQAAQ